jgi:Phosphoglucomutase
MMNGMLVFPLVVREKGEDPRYRPDDRIRLSASKERLMAAVMENDEDPDHESSSQNRKRQRDPDGDRQTYVSETP